MNLYRVTTPYIYGFSFFVVAKNEEKAKELFMAKYKECKTVNVEFYSKYVLVQKK